MKMYLALSCAALLLAGCYASDEPVIEKGEQVPLKGKITCMEMGGSSRSESWTETRNGMIFGDYSYSNGKETLKFGRSNGDIYIVQTTDPKARYGYMFAEFDGKKRMIVSIANLMANPMAFNQLAIKNGVSLQDVKGSDGLLKIVGPKDRALAFLKAHDKTGMMAVMSCELGA
jgi:hypothetical protein